MLRVKERPILFSGEMVRAILDGRKTQTRRVVDRMAGFRVNQFGRSTTEGYDWHFRCQRGLWHDVLHSEAISRCPYGQPDDHLWVRETFSFTRGDYPFCRKPSEAPQDSKVWYRAANDRPTWAETKWHPSIFMPRWASRLTIKIRDVRVEQLRSITEEDAESEGVTDHAYVGSVNAFESLWELINGAESLAANPWVWVIDFEKVD
ncbi:ASCH domain-containing protein [Crateriforma conspicua]|uniref:Morphogenetic protein n=1 Tax=Crateriforma conspicua TaxID=2527996 RepID=A0A5C5XTH7_9PLAN|nr:hypothetical protein [Crateriforma conspicua]TWT65643.1 hypothetical protein Pan14r_51900 [Crateriforma conspicua]